MSDCEIISRKAGRPSSKKTSDMGGSGGGSELSDLALSIFRAIPFKIAGLLFIVLIFVNTTVFIEGVLSNVPGAVGPMSQVTGKGAVLTSMGVCIFYIFVDILVEQGVL